MVEKTPETGREGTGKMAADVAMNASELKAWFVREVLPLEAILMHFLRHNWRDASEI